MMVRDRGPAMAHTCACGWPHSRARRAVPRLLARSSSAQVNWLQVAELLVASSSHSAVHSDATTQDLNGNRRRDRDGWSSAAAHAHAQAGGERTQITRWDGVGEITRSLNLFPYFFCSRGMVHLFYIHVRARFVSRLPKIRSSQGPQHSKGKDPIRVGHPKGLCRIIFSSIRTIRLVQ
jgi:hypothetical protein